MLEDKPALRLRLKAARQQLSADTAWRLSSLVIERVMDQIEWREVKTMHVYSAMEDHREVDTSMLLEKVWERFPGIRTASWSNDTSFWVGPRGGETVDDGQKYDLIIVPLVGFNKDCHRVGFGGGSYDRFLAGQPQAKAVGLAFDFQLCEFVPEAHDVPLDAIATETSWFRPE